MGKEGHKIPCASGVEGWEEGTGGKVNSWKVKVDTAP